jgi:hypothetical protein
MTIEQLERVHRIRPFIPFRIHVADGSSVLVRHPELLVRAPAGRTILVNTGENQVEVIDLLLVTKLSYEEAPSAAWPEC